MRCPNCGFENMPGLDACGLCRGKLAAPAEPVSVYPPRARERTARDRMAWTVERVHGPRPSPDREAATSGANVRGVLRAAALATAAVVPGVGYRLAGDRATARLHAAAAVAAAAMGAALFRTRVADLALAIVAGLSIASVVRAVDTLYPPAARETLEMRRRGLALMLFAVYLGTFAVAPQLVGLVYILNVHRDSAVSPVMAGDRLLMVARWGPRRGDVVHAARGFGRVLALPGETVRLDPGDTTTYTLGPREYWVPGSVEGYPLQRTPRGAGVVTRSDIRGRAVAVLNPPARRGLFRPQRHLDDGE